MSATLQDQTQALSIEADGTVAVVPEQHPQACPVCRRDDGLWVEKGDRWQVWHPSRLFPCGVYPA
jgi:hypothetical protein